MLRTTLPTSHGFVPQPKEGQNILNPFELGKKSPFIYNFQFVGTLDVSPWLCIPDVLEWRESIGGEAAIREYCLDLNEKASKRVAGVLRTEVMNNAKGSLTKCFMSMVRLPLAAAEIRELAARSGRPLEGYDLGVKVRDFLTATLVKDHGTFLALTVLWNDAWWVRLSATIYLDMDDFEWAASTLQAVCVKVKGPEFIAWLEAKDAGS